MPRVWTDIRLRLNGNLSNHDLAPECKRIAANVADECPERGIPHPQVVFLLHFFDELRRRAAAASKAVP
jgi:hypothetical protein